MKFKKLSIILSCFVMSSTILPTYVLAESAEIATESKEEATEAPQKEETPKQERESTEVHSVQSTTSEPSTQKEKTSTEEKNTEKEKKETKKKETKTPKETNRSESKKKEEKKKESNESTEENKEEENPVTSTENVRDTMPVPSDLASGDSPSGSTAMYGMPEESIHGYTAEMKEKTKAFDEDIKEKEETIQTVESQKNQIGELITSLELSYEDISSLPSFQGQAYSLGTLRIKADKERIPSVYHLDDKIQEIVELTGNESLKQWADRYTLDSYCSVEFGQKLGIGDTSDVAPILLEVINKQKERIPELDNQINGIKEEIKTLQEDKDQIAKERIFNPNDVTIPSNLTVEEVTKMLSGTNLEHLSATFVECEKKYNINAVFLMSIAAHESGWGNSRRARYDHNFTGYGVYSDSATGINSDKDEANIDLTASKLRENYLNENGRYYKGKRVCDVHSTYCATGGWSKGVCSAAYKVMERILDNPSYDKPGQDNNQANAENPEEDSSNEN